MPTTEVEVVVRPEATVAFVWISGATAATDGNFPIAVASSVVRMAAAPPASAWD